jgi:hypothetical protein
MSEFNNSDHRQLAEAVREACIAAALAGYEDAGVSGLCYEGRWECAISAMRVVDLDAVLASLAAK